MTLLSAHYRQPLDFSLRALQEAKSALDRMYTALRTCEATEVRSVIGLDAVQSALEDDLNTPKAVAELHKLVSEFNRASNSNEKVKIKGAILAAGKLLGLLQINPEDWFKRVAGDIDDAKIEEERGAEETEEEGGWE